MTAFHSNDYSSGGARPCAPAWLCAGRSLDLARPLVMGILNVTPDSFSDGGEHDSPEAALDWALRMREEGADVIDVGGEATRPHASPVPLDEERRRVIPVVRMLAREGLVISVDTSRPEIMREAAAEGAAILNDVRGFELSGAAQAAAETDCGLVVMHKGRPASGDAALEVLDYLERRALALEGLGVARERICIDPGYGFGKTVEQNFELLAATPALAASGRPVMTAISRKSSLGRVTGRDEPLDRITASVAGALLAARAGARVLRVHDVRETVDALAVLGAFRAAEGRLAGGRPG